jgi:aminopeptidase N
MVSALGLVAAALAPFANDAGMLQGGTSGPMDVLSYVISIEIASDVDTLIARTDVRLTIEAGSTDRLRFDLMGLTVDSTVVDAERAMFQQGPDGVTVNLNRRRAVGDTLDVAIYYHGAPADGLLFGRNAHGRPTVFADNWPARARFWFPCVDHPSDKAAVEFRVMAPAEWSVVANGRLLEASTGKNGRTLTVWRADRPIPVYTMVVGAAEMVVREVGTFCDEGRDRCVPITQWSFPEDEERAARLFRRAPEVVAFFDSLVGPFPYEKLALVQSTTRYGGMENASAIFFTERLSEGRRGEGLVAHEIAHQWFGDAVTEREWPHLWLSEGFATYFASVFFEFVDGEAAARRARADNEGRYMASFDDVQRPIIEDEPDDLFQLLNANNYQKGAWVLHMLRQLIGDEAFFEGIRRYYAEFRHGTALSSDLQRVMEESSGKDLGWYFDQWLRRPGYPEVEARVSWDEAARALKLRIIQSQSWPAFRFPLRIDVQSEDFSLARTFWIDARESRFTWSMPGKPDAVIVDPENALLGPTKIELGAGNE